MHFVPGNKLILCRDLISISRRLCHKAIKSANYSTVANEEDKKTKSLTICGQTYASDTWTNVTPRIISLTGQRLTETPSNPLRLISKGIKEHFADYDAFKYLSPVVDLESNFDSLLVAKDHVSRAKADTYYVNSNFVLRSHTSAHQAHCLSKGSKAFYCIADVYRRDAIDATHFPVFHQCEILKLYSKDDVPCDCDIIQTAADRTDRVQEHHTKVAAKFIEDELKSVIESYIKKLLGQRVKMRWVSAYFPFTHPSLELEVLFNGQWMEILGAGVVEHKLLEKIGITDKIGWALGFGLERLAMLKYAIPDIRLFWTKDTGFLSQFKDAGPWDAIRYKQVSVYPQCINDMSFWLVGDSDFSPNDFYDLVRTVGGDLVEQVNLIDDFTNKQGRRSHCYRIVYRSCDRTLSQSEVTNVHKSIGTTAAAELGVQIRGGK